MPNKAIAKYQTMRNNGMRKERQETLPPFESLLDPIQLAARAAKQVVKA
jgi:hypothetical protein